MVQFPRDDFPITGRNRVKRAYQRGQYDRKTVFTVLDATPLCHIGYSIENQPYVTPTLVWREEDRLYWHGSSASRMLRSVAQEVPVCVTAASFDGWVLARSGFHHSANYRSVMAFGHARLVKAAGAKINALKVMMDQLFPGRWDGLRPMTQQELKATTIVSMHIEDASVKIRSGPSVDDEEDYDLDIWAGVLPMTASLEMPIPDPRLKPNIAFPQSLLQVGRGPTMPDKMKREG